MFIPPPIPPPLMAPFDREISPPRKRTRTTPQQLEILEKSFTVNPSPNHRIREQLSLQLGMPERSIQIWFQNRRAKVKNQAKRSAQMKDSLALQQKYAASAATAACQTVMLQQGQTSIDPNLYYYYYYYYFHQQQQQQYPLRVNTAPPILSSSPYPLGHPPPSSSSSSTCSTAINQQLPPDLTLSASTSTSSIKSDTRRVHSERTRAHSVGPYPTYYHRNSTPPTLSQERHASLARNSFFFSIKTEKYPLSAQTLQIGNWKRVCDIQCQIDITTRSLVWCIGDDQQNFRADIELQQVQFIRVTQNNIIEFCLTDPSKVKFYMKLQNQWTPCQDFTQDKQASTEHLHVLEGDASLLSQLSDIMVHAPDLQALLIDEGRVLNLTQQHNTTMADNMLLLQSLHLPLQ
ncbi:homeobox-domain-containing protein [Backusella circina FSU 941]|nr:homeobox-domain-containing protein [Backusella circina FSU 941]